LQFFIRRKELLSKLRTLIFGKKIDPNDSSVIHKLALVAFLAWVGLGSDGLSSSCYGPSEVLQTLSGHNALALFVAIASTITIFVISSSYSQIIELFPHGGGGYLVASKLLSPKWGMISGTALLIDYILTITVSIASGADAFFSLLPQQYLHWKLPFAVFILLLLLLMNMRGVKESVTLLVPIFMVFVLTHAFVIIYAIITHSFDLPSVVSNTQTDLNNSISTLGVFGTFMLLIKAYSMGAGTYTGIEAVSNGIPILREPKVKTAKKTMMLMSISLSVTVFGLLLAYLLYNVNIEFGKTANAVLFSKMTMGWNSIAGSGFIIVILLSEAFILFVAAQTGFLDGPRVLANMAIDKWVPTKFSNLNDRLVTKNGILMMGISAIILMVLSDGKVSFLVVLYSINVFITFVLSQLGMVKHWLSVRDEEPKWIKKLIINGLGLFLSLSILIFVVIVKFYEGGWITILITMCLVLLFSKIKKHYNETEAQLKKFNNLIDPELLLVDEQNNQDLTLSYDKYGKTGVLLVSNYSGIGIHSLLSIIRMFDKTMKNIVFISVGQIDSNLFKHSNEMEELNARIRTDVHKYVEFANKLGYYSEAYTDTAIDVIEKIDEVVDIVSARFPESIFFGGQLVPKHETMFSKYFHNYSVFKIQKELYHRGIQFIILPIKLN
jgi:amino acid transporter